jgi:solute carrier family 35, member C2
MGLTLLVAGETKFNTVGFILVMLASMLSGLRWTITQVLLQGSDQHGKFPPHGPT